MSNRQKIAYTLIALVAIICVIFSLKNAFPTQDTNTEKEGKTSICIDLRPVLSISFNPEKRNIVYASCGYFYGVNNAVVKSSNYGKSFRRLRNGLVVTTNPINPDTVFVTTRKELFRSTDSGKSWSKIELKGLEYVEIRDIKVSQKTGAVYLLTSRGLFMSEDNGIHFTNIGLDNVAQYKIFLGTGKDNTIYACVGDNGHLLLRSSDNGKSWKEIDEGLNRHLVTALAVSPKDENTILVGTSITTGESGSPHKETGIFKSTDGGLHWKNVGLYDFVYALTVDPNNTNIVYAGTDKGLFKSIDCGEMWKEVKLSDTENPIYSITIDPYSHIVYLGTRGAIYRIKEDIGK